MYFMWKYIWLVVAHVLFPKIVNVYLVIM
jgi:hypothetical protein